ncbi:hypothetical protein FB451DRAFT_1185914 [Mycena latifolia]|nr:hypothetical protein FB451DRAFT_1185914 [Mycena latifolia]
MKPFSMFLLVFLPLFIAANAWQNIRDAPSTTVDIPDGQTGTLMVLPPRQTDTATKRVPDDDHPFIAPGPKDMRGRELLLLENFDPTAMNILTNHGYIARKYGVLLCPNCVLLILSRSGIAALKRVRISMSRPIFFSPLSTKAYAGKSFVNKIFIDGVSPFVPPGEIDGPETQGIAKHGRVKGDAWMTRSDVHIDY